MDTNTRSSRTNGEGVVIRQPDAFSFDQGIEGDLVHGGPVAGDAWHCTSDYDQPRDNGLGYHGALDCAPAPGGRRDLLVVATNSARVENVRMWNGVSGPGGSYGNVVILRHDDGEAALYAHLASFSATIEAWTLRGSNAWDAPYVERGEVLGAMGNTGNVWPVPVPGDIERGKHLHFEVRTRPELGSILIDPVARFAAPQFTGESPVPIEPPEPNPTPNVPLDLSLSAAIDEALLLDYLIGSLVEHPLSANAYDAYQGALDVIDRELREYTACFDNDRDVHRDPILDEARLLLQAITLYRTLDPDQYATVLTRVRSELAEQVVVLRAAS